MCLERARRTWVARPWGVTEGWIKELVVLGRSELGWLLNWAQSNSPGHMWGQRQEA